MAAIKMRFKRWGANTSTKTIAILPANIVGK